MLRWIDKEIECRPSANDCLTATLPILKPNGDAIEIGIEPAGAGRWKLSDLGETYATLYLAGVDLFEEYVRAAEFKQIISSHRITNNEDQQELMVETSSGELVGVMFDFVHAIQSMLALQLTVQPRHPKRDFASVVAKFLAEQHASFEVPAEYVNGRTGKWRFNFILNHVSEETLVKALTARNKNEALRSAEQSVFEIGDVRGLRKVQAVVIADDEDGRQAFWQPQVMKVFDGYNVPVYPFVGNRQELMQFASRYAVPSKS
ncbi:MAG: DUF1828 domain-containing protein [Bryobacteraceae bacterium]